MIAQDQDGRRMGLLRWGLVPVWAKDPAMGSRMINARSETVAEKPAFRRAFRSRRCAGARRWILRMEEGSDGGEAEKAAKVPHWIHRPGAGSPS